ncbi:MAG: hypothetical protein HQL89_01925 [Magnetococcales bacterium]|nr:hypothetical protein [Magnetococcales bacterium]
MMKWTAALLMMMSWMFAAGAAKAGGSEWHSDFGPVHLDVNPDGSVSGRYSRYQGTLAGQVADDGSLALIWLQPTSERRCRTPQVGTHYWGRVSWRANEDGSRLLGEWSYCDDPTGSGGRWNASLRSGYLP